MHRRPDNKPILPEASRLAQPANPLIDDCAYADVLAALAGVSLPATARILAAINLLSEMGGKVDEMTNVAYLPSRTVENGSARYVRVSSTCSRIARMARERRSRYVSMLRLDTRYGV